MGVGSVRPGGRSAQVRRAILDATRTLLVEAGWAGFSVDEVARRAGVHKTTVYRRWPDRLALAVAALADRGEAMVPVADTGCLRGDLAALVAAVRGNLADPAGAELARALAAEIAVHPEVVSVSRSFFHDRFARATQIVQRAVARGEIATVVQPSLVVESVVAPIWFRFLTTGELMSADEASRTLDVVVAGLVAETVGDP